MAGALANHSAPRTFSAAILAFSGIIVNTSLVYRCVNGIFFWLQDLRMNIRMRTNDIPVCSLHFKKSKTTSLIRVFLSDILAHFSGKSTFIIRQGCSNELLCLIFTRLSLQNIRQYISNWRNCLTLGFSHSSQIQPVADPGNNGRLDYA